MKHLSYMGLLLFLSLAMTGCADDDYIMQEVPPQEVMTRAGETIFQNQTVTTNRTVTGTDIVSTNITVRNGALLTLKGTNSVTINQPFTLEAGCQLTITH